jgi:hypothetical protein
MVITPREAAGCWPVTATFALVSNFENIPKWDYFAERPATNRLPAGGVEFKDVTCEDGLSAISMQGARVLRPDAVNPDISPKHGAAGLTEGDRAGQRRGSQQLPGAAVIRLSYLAGKGPPALSVY